MIQTESFNSTYLKNELNSSGYIEGKNNVDVVYLDGKYYSDPLYNKVKCRVKNIVDNQKYDIADKGKLYDNALLINLITGGY